MKIEISLTDLWTENDQNITEAIKDHVIYMCKTQIWEAIKKETKEKIEIEVTKTINEAIYSSVQEKVSEIITTNKLKKKYSGGDLVSVDEWIIDEVTRLTLNGNSLADNVKRQADLLAKQMKDRFDMLFASQLVSKMNEVGMLKEDVAKILLDKKD